MSKKISTLFHTSVWVLIYIFLGINNVLSVKVDIPWDYSLWTRNDINVPIKTSSGISWDQSDIIDLIKLINNYLRLSLGVVCLVVAVYGGFILITAQWDKSKLQKANQILLGTGIWLIICVMAYVLVRVVVNLF